MAVPEHGHGLPREVDEDKDRTGLNVFIVPHKLAKAHWSAYIEDAFHQKIVIGGENKPFGFRCDYPIALGGRDGRLRWRGRLGRHPGKRNRADASNQSNRSKSCRRAEPDHTGNWLKHVGDTLPLRQPPARRGLTSFEARATRRRNA
jgi:hypothetical protein